MLLELAGYPLRPTRQPGESLAGFVSRHFGTNGHWMPEALHRALSTLYRSEDASAREEVWELICSLTGQASPVDHQIWVKERFTLPEAAPRRKGRHWQRAYSSKVRVCPHCLAEHGVHLAIWELPLVDVCPRHGGLLVHRCECGDELTWPSMGPDWTCRCGKPLSSLPSRPASGSLRPLAQVIAAASGLPFPWGSPSSAGRIATNLRQTYEALFWLQGLVALIAETSQNPMPPEPRPGRRVGYLLRDWPNGMAARIRRLLGFRHRHDQNSLVLLLDDTHPSKRLLDYLANTGALSSVLPADLLQSARAVVEHLRSPIGPAPTLIFNPALSISERQQRLTSLRDWWSDLRDRMKVEEAPRVAPSSPLLHLDSLDARFRMLLINVLVNAARTEISPQSFRRFAVVWPPARPLPANANPDLFIQALDAQLRTVSSAHLQYLCELACHAAGVTRAAV